MSTSAFRVVTIPPAVPFRGGSITFRTFVGWLLLTGARFNRTMAGGRAALRIEETLGPEPAEGAQAKLHPDDWKLLHEEAESPAGPMVLPGRTARGEDGSLTVPMAVLVPFADALSEERTRGPAPDAAPTDLQIGVDGRAV